MNNKGQTLVLFVALIPVMLILFAFIFDSSYIARKNSELEGIAKSSLRNVMENNNSWNEIKKVIKKNDKNIEIIEMTDNEIHLTNKIEPIFGKIIGFDKYSLEIDLVGTYQNGKLLIEEKGK